MSETDDFDLPVTAASARAAGLYRRAIDAFLAADESVERLLDELLREDPDCALGRIALARLRQSQARGAEARLEAERALALAPRLTAREAGHIDALASVVRGEGPAALARVTAHLERHPLDLFVLAPVCGVFGLFGFSGEPGREEALYRYLEPRRPALQHHWWFRASLAFAACETGRLDEARRDVEQAWLANPASANTAHIRAHVDYEQGRDRASLDWLGPWFEGYGSGGLMHCHLGWHLALAHLRLGDASAAEQAFRRWVRPLDRTTGQGAWGPPLNLVTDSVSWLFRAQLRGLSVSAESWAGLLKTARSTYPKPGLRFADFHVAIGLAMTGASDELSEWVEGVGDQTPVARLIQAAAVGFEAIAQGQWESSARALAPALEHHEVLGGSRAQRDLLVEAWQVARAGGRPLSGVANRPLAV